MRILIVLIVMVFSLVSNTEWAYCQLVRIGPGGSVRIRAPFVAIDIGPYGETSVRAPFTAVDVPGNRHPSLHDYSSKDQSRSGPANGYPNDKLGELRESAGRLDRELGRYKAGRSWQRYLRLPGSHRRRTPPSDTEEESELVAEPSTADWEEVLFRFDLVTQTPEYHRIASLPSFTATHTRLSDYVQSLDDLTPDPPFDPLSTEELPEPSP